MPNSTTNNYLEFLQQNRNDWRLGSFAQSALNDPNFPKADSFETISDYLKREKVPLYQQQNFLDSYLTYETNRKGSVQ